MVAKVATEQSPNERVNESPEKRKISQFSVQVKN